MKKLMFILGVLLVAGTAWAGFWGFNGNNDLGVFNKFVCSTGLTCTQNADQFVVTSSPSLMGNLVLTAPTGSPLTLDLQANNDTTNGDDWQLKSTTSEGGLEFLNNTSGSQAEKALLDTSGDLTIEGNLTVSGTGSTTITGALSTAGGIGDGDTTFTTFSTWEPAVAATPYATPTPVATGSVYVTQIHIAHNETSTGCGILNGTVGSNKWFCVLYNKSGTVIANTATAGVSGSGNDAFQKIPWTSTTAITGPGTYWIGLMGNGTTDTYFTIPSLGQAVGLAGVVTGQTFGTAATIVVPTTFTPGDGPVAYIY